MNFKYKCLLQRFFSNIPKGETLNYYFQKNVIKSLPPNNEKFLEKVNKGFNHYKNYKDYNKLTQKDNRYYEFGAGWTLTIPLTMSFLDFQVFCVDIRKLVIPSLINDSLNKFQLNKNELPFKLETEFVISNKNVLNNLIDNYKLNYIAPKDARETGFDDNHFDFISSSVTLEHIPKNDILLILKECYRILNKGGILSMTIDYQDHWSYFDKNISIYNYLKYTSREWKKYNPSLHYQNRMRHSDYLSLISQTDFKIVKEVPRQPNEIDKETLSKIEIAEEFKNYEFEDLAIRGSEIVLIK
jgi:predicted SAM-dependent methyltransferase